MLPDVSDRIILV